MKPLYGEESGDDSQHNSRQQIGYPNTLVPNQVYTDTEDQYRADHRKVTLCGWGHNRPQQGRQRRHTALQDTYRNSREDTTFAQRAG